MRYAKAEPAQFPSSTLIVWNEPFTAAVTGTLMRPWPVEGTTALEVLEKVSRDHNGRLLATDGRDRAVRVFEIRP